MYDTIGLRMDHQDTALIRSRFEASEGWVQKKREEFIWTGHLKNLYVKVTPRFFSMTGSLPKWYLGSGFAVLTRKLTAEAIEKLCDTVRLDLRCAQVYRIDVGANFLVSKPVRSYTHQLGRSGRHSIDTYNNRQSLYYRKTGRELVFYDKVAEIKAKKKGKDSIPREYLNGNVLRYESKITSRAAHYFGFDNIFAADLSEDLVFGRANQRWFDEYSSISKNRVPLPGIHLDNCRSLSNSLSSYGIWHCGGKEAIQNQIDTAKEQGRLHKTKASRLKKKLDELAKMEKFSIGTDEMIELDELVKQRYESNLKW